METLVINNKSFEVTSQELNKAQFLIRLKSAGKLIAADGSYTLWLKESPDTAAIARRKAIGEEIELMEW